MAKAFLDDILLTPRFSVVVLKALLGDELGVADLSIHDPELHKNLSWMLENSVDGVIEETFTTTIDIFGEVREEELIPGGREKFVTDENKAMYIKLRAKAITRSIEKELETLVRCFHELVPKDHLTTLSITDLDIALSGFCL